MNFNGKPLDGRDMYYTVPQTHPQRHRPNIHGNMKQSRLVLGSVRSLVHVTIYWSIDETQIGLWLKFDYN